MSPIPRTAMVHGTDELGNSRPLCTGYSTEALRSSY
ncbi:rCG31533, isoform CRA_b [Rattus norvegicus]|uniref:RCG31533, isoform CRA_b n=1 Tax=Rattus norvegicus TaxID=10116 RepID=A6IU95_RAT|nr:rCG31533, isoform CRA_b [Rattus norvegicus]